MMNVNAMVYTTIIRSGLTIDHRKPKTEPRYFSFRSLVTRFFSSSR